MGYWDMVAGIANRGLVDEELFPSSTGEQWGVWESTKADGRGISDDVQQSGATEQLRRALQALRSMAGKDGAWFRRNDAEIPGANPAADEAPEEGARCRD